MSGGALASRIDADGYAVLEDGLPVDTQLALRNEVDRLLAERATPFGEGEFLGTRTQRIFNLLGCSAAFEDLVEHDALLPLIEALLGPEFLLSSLTAIVMHPGETPQPLHCDDGTLPLPKPHPAYTATAIWALTDFTAENGATRVVPGSHREDRKPQRGEAPPTRSATMSAGSALVYHGSLWHGGDANRSDGRRIGIVANYCAGFLRQEECQLLALPRERVAAFSPRLRALIGYGTYRGLLGHVDQRSPATLVDPDARTDMVWSRIRS